MITVVTLSMLALPLFKSLLGACVVPNFAVSGLDRNVMQYFLFVLLWAKILVLVCCLIFVD